MMSRNASLMAVILTRGSMVALVTALAGAGPALAQTGSAPALPADEAAATEQTGLADIIVTAQRRGERLQSTPLTVTAITGDAAAQKGVVHSEDLQIVTPGLVFADSGIGPAIYLRGVGTQNTGFGDEGSIATYVDGVAYTSLPAAFSSLANVERVEVLKGPQGTLFGRNATGGLINIITKDPSFTPEMNLSANVGTYQTVGGEVYGTMPLGNTVAANFSGHFSQQFKGWGKNVFNGKDVYKGSELAVRSKLLWQPGSDTRFVLSGDYSRRRDSSSSGAVDFGAIGIGGNSGLRDFYDYDSSLQPVDLNRTGGVSLHAQHDLSFARLISISAYRINKFYGQFDNDRSARQIADVTFDVRDKQFTQELQIQNLASSRVKWILGAYYLRASNDQRDFLIRGAAVAGFGGSANFPAYQKTRSLAGYGQLTVPLGDQTNVTGGIRFTRDKRDLSASIVLPAIDRTIPRAPKSIQFEKVTFRAAVDHHITPDVMVFASFNRGFKSGIFNLLAAGDPPARPEVLDAYEAGVKSEFFDRRLRLNISPFMYKYKDIQLSTSNLTASRLINAARATVKGIDADMALLVTKAFQIDASAEYLDGRYDSFQNAPNSFPNPATCGPPPMSLPGPRRPGNLNCPIDATGFRMIRAPKFAYAIGARYKLETDVGTFNFSANYFHTSQFSYEAGQRLKQAPYGLVNAQIAWRSLTDRFGVRVYGRNLLDERYFTNRVSASGGDTHASAAPLTAGIALDVKL